MMGPDYLKLVTAVLGFLQEIGSWPIAAILFTIIIGPWLLAVLLAWGQAKRFNAVKEMYEHNVELVKGYEQVCKRQDEREQSLRDLIHLDVQAMTRLVDRMDGERRVTG
jgi:hypothetical protein